MAGFMFWFFAVVAVAGALLVTFQKRLVNSAFALAGTLVGVAGLYWSLGADFLGTTQILLYVGGVAVLLLYAVMLTPKESTRVPLLGFLPAAVVTAAAAVLVVIAFQGVGAGLAERAAAPGAPEPTAAAIGRAFLERDRFLAAFELASVLLLVVVVGAVYIARRRKES